MRFQKAMRGNFRTWLKGRTLIQKVVIVILIIGMVVIWPLCLVRDAAENRSGDGEMELTRELQVGMSVEQRFRAEWSYLRTVDYVLGFDPESPLEGTFLFELLDEGGNLLYSTEYPYNMTPDYRYCDIKVNQRLRKGREYVYRLTNLSVTQNVPCVAYTGEEAMYAVNNCGMTFNGNKIQGESLTRYTWSIPYRWEKVLLYWGSMGMAAFCICELEEIRKVKRVKRVKNPLV